ncbi:MAG: Mur ligase [Gammaproteobacteria bacterium]|nr:Mur ligase [Gammaproteobacteria bacterium]
MLEVVGLPIDEELLRGWRSRLERARSHLHWTESAAMARRHAGGVSLALAAPCDQLFLATEINEWALCATLQQRDPARWQSLAADMLAAALADAADPACVLPPVLSEAEALARFDQLAAREARPQLRALLAQADARGLPHLLDDSELTLGAGSGGRTFALAALPAAAGIGWQELHGIPTVLVTGSNGKTTTVRLLAACARAHGWHVAYNCTDGVFIDGETLASGDYSGPAGTRRVLRERRTEAAILETARGGILRRGIAVSRADVAVVTNISADHFGEYGIHDLAGLADAKLTVGALLDERGLLVLNADDPQLRARAASLPQRFARVPRTGWFALDAGSPELQAYHSAGAPTCGVQDGRLLLRRDDRSDDLGAVESMPLTIGGAACYNIANLAAAALAAAALGIAPATIAAVAARFGADPGDNPGRLMRYDYGGAQVLVDYAHNPEGLRGLLRVAVHLQRRSGGRIGLLLGHAGNRQDEDIEQLAGVAARFRPDLVVVKENEAHLRGRAAGEIPRIIHAALLRHGMPGTALAMRNTELEAARCALDWARPGDVLALPVHSQAARAAVLGLLAPPPAPPPAA